MENAEDLFSSSTFQNYRNNFDKKQIKNNIKKDDDKHYSVDSAYNSEYSCYSVTSNSSLWNSSQPSGTSTYLQSSSINLTNSANSYPTNNLEIELSDCEKNILTLTPVTQNTERISAFHITTPSSDRKSKDYINKRLYNEEFQSTPKKLKYCNFEAYSTPQKFTSNKNDFNRRLSLIPNLENKDNGEIWKTPKKCMTANQSTPKRTPLQSVQQKIQTPTNLFPDYELTNVSKKFATVVPKTYNASMNTLINCSNDEFNSILNSDSITSQQKRICGSIKRSKKLVDNENGFEDQSYSRTGIENTDSHKSFRRFLKFSSQSCSSSNQPSELGKPHKNLSPIQSVINDRFKVKKRVNTARLGILGRQNAVDMEENISKSLSTDDKTEVYHSTSSTNMMINQVNSYKKTKMEYMDSYPNIVDLKKENRLEQLETDNSELKEEKVSQKKSIQLISQSDSINNIHNKDFMNFFEHKCRTERDAILITPPRKLSRSPSTSSQTSMATIDKEKFKILYPSIPETPRKNLNLNSKKSPKKIKKNEKSSQHGQRIFYNGATHLNIIAKLEPYPVVLENIFQRLSDIDLLNLTMTTKTYRAIIQNNYKANVRLTEFIKHYKISKENYFKESQSNKKVKSDSLCENYKKCKVKAFSLHNEKLNYDCNFKDELKSENSTENPVSISATKKNFYEYQKLIKNLSEEENMSKCPRCSMASCIIKQSTLEMFPNIQVNTLNNKNCNKFEKSKHDIYTKRNVAESEKHSIKELSSTLNEKYDLIYQNKMKNTYTRAFSLDSFKQISSRNQDLLEETSKYAKYEPYGECTSIQCKFKYCLQCFCDYHPQRKCKLSASISPTKEDIQNGILQVVTSPKKYNCGSKNNNDSRSLNMRRKALKRLCFN